MEDERIVMTPTKKTSNSTTLLMERKAVSLPPASASASPLATPGKGGDGVLLHVAGGNNAGIVVNKRRTDDENGAASTPSQLSLEFRVFLVNASTGRYTQERRTLDFWFKDDYEEESWRASAAQEFFKKLVSPQEFPRDYVGFIKKIMKLMQREYPMIAKIQVQLTQEREMESLPNRPIISEEKAKKEVTADSLLGAIEEAYPNSLTVDDMARRFVVEKELVKNKMLELVSRQLVKQVGVVGVPGVDSSATAYRRTHGAAEGSVTVVKGGQLGPLRGDERALQPTIAVVTSQYHEKVAVDAVMTNKRTFVRYATVGEANVYTLGDIGPHRVVTTKLPMTGRSREALTAAGSTTTRLLGTFQDVESVFLVGVGGAVPHFADFDQHVRLGDVIMSAPARDVKGGKPFIYQYCEGVSQLADGSGFKFETRSWCPDDLQLQEIARQMVSEHVSNPAEAPWLGFFQEALDVLEAEMGSGADGVAGWRRPPQETDKLYMSVGGGDLIEVAHPAPRDGREDPRSYGEPVLHLGPVASGTRRVVHDQQLRQALSHSNRIRCYDPELDAVVESVYGNRKERYMLVRGAADYGSGVGGGHDGGGAGGPDDGGADRGLTSRAWQLYSSLMAAAVTRALVERMPSARG